MLCTTAIRCRSIFDILQIILPAPLSSVYHEIILRATIFTPSFSILRTMLLMPQQRFPAKTRSRNAAKIQASLFVYPQSFIV